MVLRVAASLALGCSGNGGGGVASADGRGAEPVLLEDDDVAPVGNLRVAVDANGNAVVVWAQAETTRFDA